MEMCEMWPCIAERSSARRSRNGGRSWTLGEQPNNPDILADPRRLARWLDVENSERWQPRGKSTTYCNVYASDFLHLLGLYLPRQWWKEPYRVADMGFPPDINYGVNTREMSANALYDWLPEFGEYFRWDVHDSMPKLHDDEVCVIVTPNANGHGHVVLAFQDWATQAGTTNHESMDVPDYTGRSAYYGVTKFIHNGGRS